jgi:hypothetical protein
MNTYQAFLTCKGQEAIWRIAKGREVVPAVKGKVCGSSEGAELFLCHSCLNYWKQCAEIRLAIAWEFALERRKAQQRV